MNSRNQKQGPSDVGASLPSRGHSRALFALTIMGLASFFVMHVQVDRQCPKGWAFAADDPYIHMSMAKHWYGEGVHGIDGKSFTSASSSPAWLALLVGLAAMGILSSGSVLAVNMAATLGIIVLWAAIAGRWIKSSLALVILTVMFLLPVPLFAACWLGMEHTLHALVLIGLVWYAVRVTELHRIAGVIPLLGLAFLAALLGGLRYESVFVVIALSGWAAFRRKWRVGVAICAGAAMPVIVYGVFLAANGESFVPNSVLSKATSGTSVGVQVRSSYPLLQESLKALWFKDPWLLALIGGACAALIGACSAVNAENQRRRLVPIGVLAVFLVTAVCQLRFVPLGVLLRYQVGVAALGGLAVVIGLAQLWPDLVSTNRYRTPLLAVLTGIAVVVVYPAWRFRCSANWAVPVACQSIHNQQSRMADFVREFYAGRTVAVNDIGIMSWSSEARIVDLWGWANHEILLARIRGTADSELLQTISDRNQVALAIVYDSWFKGGESLPTKWERVGRWVCPRLGTCDSRFVSFYAPDATGVDRLTRELLAYADQMASGVELEITSQEALPTIHDTQEPAATTGTDAAQQEAGRPK